MAKASIDVMLPGVSTSWPNLLKLLHMYAANILGCVWNVGFVIKGALGLLIYRNIATLYRDEESEWFEPVSALEGDIIKITKETLEANIALIKKEVNPEDEDDNDEDLP